MTRPARRVFDLADAELASLWREGPAIGFRAVGPLSPELTAALRDHRGDLLAALTAYPGGRREPGADTLTATDAAETLLAGLPDPLREYERGRWCADLASAWAKGVNGREAAEVALGALRKRVAGHRSAPGPGAEDGVHGPERGATLTHLPPPGVPATSPPT